VINPAVFASHLFLRPSYGHYYFGDYYGSNYSSNGFSPWFSFFSSGSGYDPFYAHQHWQHRNDDQWNRKVQADFTHRRDHEDARPPRTFAAQRQLRGNGRPEQNMESVIAQQLEQFRKAKESSIRFQQVDNDDRQQFGRRGQEVQKHRQQRQELEAKTVDSTAEPSVRGGPSARVKLSQSPFVAKRPDEFGENQRPPQTHALPQLDPKLVPQPRRQRSPRADTRPAPPNVKVGPKTAPKVDPQAPPPKDKPQASPPQASPPKAAPPKGKPQDKPKGKPKGKP
jgi:hypothetical protein